MRQVALLLLFTFLASCQNKAIVQQKKVSSAADYYAAQDKTFKDKSAELAKAGRIPYGYDAYERMSQYAWHGGPGGGMFGAYTFYQPAFEQAKKMWIINGFMLPGSDLLWIMDMGIKFDKSIIGRKINFMSPSSCYKDDGNTPCEEDLTPRSESNFLKNATIVDVFGHTYEFESWDSNGHSEHGAEYWRGPLRLNKRARVFLQQYKMEIVPDGNVDMCNCTVGATFQLPTAPN